jgi:hypothetical protein
VPKRTAQFGRGVAFPLIDFDQRYTPVAFILTRTNSQIVASRLLAFSAIANATTPMLGRG